MFRRTHATCSLYRARIALWLGRSRDICGEIEVILNVRHRTRRRGVFRDLALNYPAEVHAISRASPDGVSVVADLPRTGPGTSIKHNFQRHLHKRRDSRRLGFVGNSDPLGEQFSLGTVLGLTCLGSELAVKSEER